MHIFIRNQNKFRHQLNMVVPVAIVSSKEMLNS